LNHTATIMENSHILQAEAAAGFIRDAAPGRNPKIGLVLGSGLGSLADSIGDRIVIPYKDIPGFPISTAIGHKGNLILGRLGGKEVIAMQGRFHYYEGYPMTAVTIGIRTMKLLGVEYLFVSNAAGGCNDSYKVGDLVMITDHINMMPNPLVGRNADMFGPRFPDMTCAYDRELLEIGERACRECGVTPRKGVYLAGSGPSYETPAEVRFFKTIGADLIGMSTVSEVIVARHCGMRVFGMSCVTNVSNTENVNKNLNDGDDVVKQADCVTEKMSGIFKRIIGQL